MSPDHDWFERIVAASHEPLRAYAARRVGIDAADDVAAEVFAIAWRRRREAPERVLPWLYGIARNVVLHERRGFARRARLGSRLRQQRPPDGGHAQSRIEVNSILDALEPTDAEVLRLTVWEQLTPAEIAVALGITPAAARQRLSRARARAQLLHERSTASEGSHHA